jgi:Fe-Mn family superoxide dismutase
MNSINKKTMKRAEFLQKSLMLAGASVVLPSFAAPLADAFSLPALPYAFDALEPHIDRLTMEIHHDRHHKAYVDNLNKALPGTTKTIEEILASISTQPVAVRNNGGGHWNHSFFWNVLGPAKGSKPSSALAKQIDADFGSFDAFKAEFTKAATSRFGSGWTWLIKKDGKLVISSTPNQDNPLMDVAEVKGQPILALDVWEHAYYLKYMNKRADYIAAFWNLVNWDFVSTNFSK